ncbi:MAG: hypothetical protein KDD50_08980, partial [Bdellovibrionales bacterium]|nr:hypothetical protein [Bdellovibrionales bacterium]
LAELVKVHKLVPDYNGSKKLKNHCEIGEKLRLENEARRAQEEKEKQIKEKIERIVSDCSAIFNQFKNMNELNTCLFEASELNPGDENVESLRRKMTEKMELKEQQLANQRARSHRIQEGQNKFNSAEATYKKGQLAKSIKQFERYLSEEYPDPNGLKSVAQRKLASIKKQLDTKISKLLNECRKNLDDENYKESFKSCQSALNEDPSNQEARDLKHEVRVKLTKKMKELYENASIEENYGNIDAAKELWLKIKKTDFDGGSQFYSKATKKLRKYGL